MELVKIDKNAHSCPASLGRYLGEHEPGTVTALGDLDILRNKSLAVLCSNRCPGSIIIKTYDLMRELREKGVTVISGFHSAIERECLNILLKGSQPIIYCPARSIEGMKIKPELRKPLEAGRLLILSPFEAKHRRISSDFAETRNHFVAALAESIFVPYAAPGSKTEKFCTELMTWNGILYTVPDERTANLISFGARSVTEVADLYTL